MNGKVELISLSAYARLRGVAKSAVSKAVSEGRISTINGKIDPKVADVQWAQNTRARADSKKGGGDLDFDSEATDAPVATSETPAATTGKGARYDNSRAHREEFAAKQQELDYQIKAGKYVDAAELEAEVFRRERMVRDAMLGMCVKAAPELATISDAFELELRLTAYVRAALKDLVAAQ
ncbi:hypothetical protein [Variovorax atrisoli]|uniref:hypothetical protein n=1 Tax=Variovorax atrisoli TaxID=3394203 RepID=UPI00036D24C9|nr:hypothetical protein [Variovorax paradoxus]